jgi:outer membrane lipoprotein-sorting protein
MRGMDRRSLLLAFAALPALALPLSAQGTDVSAIDRYLRALRTAEGRFRQTNPNGASQSGRFVMSKPGRIRFDYDTPQGSMVIADGTNIGVFDPKSNRNPTRYPLNRTPLALLLRQDLSLREPGMVRGATRDANGTHITVVDPRQPNEGRMVMTFGEAPVTLREWVVQTANGQRTRVAVSEMRTGVEVNRSLFNIELAAANYRF